MTTIDKGKKMFGIKKLKREVMRAHNLAVTAHNKATELCSSLNRERIEAALAAEGCVDIDLALRFFRRCPYSDSGYASQEYEYRSTAAYGPNCRLSSTGEVIGSLKRSHPALFKPTKGKKS